MTSGHPDGLPELFLDRSLGRRQVPDLLREAGLHLRTLAEVYGIPADETIADVDRLARAGGEGWVVLMKDERIRYRPAERAALVDHRGALRGLGNVAHLSNRTRCAHLGRHLDAR